MKNIGIYTISVILLLASVLPMAAQERGESAAGVETGHDQALETGLSGWYVGVQGGLPFGVSDFSSFGADRTRTGFMGGVYGGYRFDGSLRNILSLEAFAKWGQFSMGERGCCADLHYWLGSDGVRYNAPVLDMTGWDYSELKSSVFMQQYGVQLNVNVLGFFAGTRDSRWTAEVSPVLAAVGTKAGLRALADNAEVVSGDARWHFGVGGNVQAAYRVTENLNVGVYTSMTYMTGRAMDGMPELHSTNYVWESGVRVGWAFGKRKVAAPAAVGEVMNRVQDDVPPGVQGDASPRHSGDVAPRCSSDASPRHSALDAGSPEGILPVIYFTFGLSNIPKAELPKVEKIKEWMAANPDRNIELIGWDDHYGDPEFNRTLSYNRAETVRRHLVDNGISSDRITVKGMGICPESEDVTLARRVECIIK